MAHDLQGQLAWLLSVDPRVPLHTALHPRVLSLPLAQQHTLALTAAACLGQECSGHMQTLLLQLLQLLGSTGSGTVTATAAWALQQHQHRLPLDRPPPPWQPPCPEPLPAWLAACSSPQHCFAWLQQPAAAPPAAPPAAATVAAVVGAPRGAKPCEGILQQGGGAPPPSCAEMETEEEADEVHQQQPQQQQGAAAQARQESGLAPASDEGAAGAPAKRRKLSEGQPAAAAGAAAAAAPGGGPASLAGTVEGAAVQLQTALDQLQALHGAGGTSSSSSNLDLPLVARVLSAAAANALQAHEQQQLQQALQQLPPDSLAVLLQELLLPGPAPGLAVNASGSGGAGGTTRQYIERDGLAFLLHAALLPQLQGLRAAAPQALVSCLVALARHGLEAQALMAQELLAPLVVSPLLQPVQVQLLLKLLRDVEALQGSVLDLLLQAALGDASSAAAPGGCCCCWHDPHAALLRGLLDSCPHLVTERANAVLAALAAAAQQPSLSRSAGFGQALMALAKGCGALLNRRQLQQLQGVASATTSFLTKPLARQLQQLLVDAAAVAQ